jgi:hypothetical protein
MMSAGIRLHIQNGCATFKSWSAFLALGSPRHWRCAAVSCGTATQGWQSGSRCASRTPNAPTDKRTALHWMPRAVWPSSTLSSPPADETHGWAVPECLGNRGIRLLFCTNVSRGIESPSRNAKERCCLGPGPPALRTERPEQRAGSLAGARVAHSVARDDMLGVALDWLGW